MGGKNYASILKNIYIFKCLNKDISIVEVPLGNRIIFHCELFVLLLFQNSTELYLCESGWRWCLESQ